MFDEPSASTEFSLRHLPIASAHETARLSSPFRRLSSVVRRLCLRYHLRRSVPFRAVPCHVREGSLHVRRVSTVLLCARGSTHLPPSIPRRLLRRSRSRCASFALETLRGACTNNRRGRLFVTYVRTYPPPSQTLPNDLPCPLALTSAPPFSQDPRTGDQEGRWTDTRRRTPRWRGSNDHTARCSCFNRRERKEARENEPVGSLLDARAMNVPCRDGCSRAIFNHAWDTSGGQTLRWTIEGQNI